MGNMAARIVGVGLAVLSALLNLAFLAVYPAWSIIVVALDIVIIYAIRPWPSAQEMTRVTGPTGIGSSRGGCRRKEHSTVERPRRVRPPAGRTSGCGLAQHR